MPLFDDIKRTETRPKNERESIYKYYNSSARETIAAVRGVLQEWFDSCPADQSDLLARLRSSIDSQHQSAFWELYLHELFTRMGYRLQPHPPIEDTPNHPDFLVWENDAPKFYLEAIVAGLPSDKDAAAEARLAEVFDLINRMGTKDYFLELQYRGMPNTPPPVGGLRADLEKWMNSLDPKLINELCKAGAFESLPRFESSFDGLTLFFRPIPRSEEQKHKTEARPIGMTMGEVHTLSTDQDIRDVIEKKSKKYGALALPLVVAANVISEHCDDVDIYNALFGSESIEFVQRPNGTIVRASDRRLPNGVWFGKNGPRNPYLSAVLIGCGITPYTSGTTTPQLVYNPYPKNPLVLPTYRLPQLVPDNAKGAMQKKEGESANRFLRLPNPWPPEMD